MWIIFVNSYKNFKLRKKLKIVGFLVEFFVCRAGRPNEAFFVSIQSHWPDFLSTSRGACLLLSVSSQNSKWRIFPAGLNKRASLKKEKSAKPDLQKNAAKIPVHFRGVLQGAGRDAFTGKEKTPPSPQLFLSPEFWEYEACERERGGGGLAGGTGRVARSNIWFSGRAHLVIWHRLESP